MIKKRPYINTLIFLFGILLCISACEKEYSYEGGAVPPQVIIDTTEPPVVITPVDPGALPSCPSCRDTVDVAASSWTFKTGSSILCGEVDTAFILNLERSSFTFFGPATCGIDTGLIFTVSLGANALTRDTTNITVPNAVFYYYHTNAPNILLSHPDQPFNMVITSYNHATRMVTGTFSGIGFRQDGRAVIVSSGKFKCRVL